MSGVTRLELTAFLQLPENVFCFRSFPFPTFPDRFFLLFILPQSFSLLSLPEGSSWGAQPLCRGAPFYILPLRRGNLHIHKTLMVVGEQGGLGEICSAHSCGSCCVTLHPCLSHHPLLSLAIAARAVAGGGAFGVAWPWWCLNPYFQGREKATWAARWPGREVHHLYLN